MWQFLKLLWQCFTVWFVPPTSLDGAQAIIAHSAGENSPSDPGRVNMYLAGIIQVLYVQLKVPVFIQGELAPCLRMHGIHVFRRSSRQAETMMYLDTLDIALWHKAECDRIGARRVVLVSYLPQFWRAMKATEKLGLEVLVPPGIMEMFDPGNSQWWARNKWVNRLYEVLVRLYFLWKGWI